MLGLIVTGHGNFASGLQSSLRLIAGDKENMCFVDFEEKDSVEDLTAKLSAAIDSLSNADGILFLCDLTGGSPFKTSVELSIKDDKPMEVIGGANLPMIIELSMAKDFIDSLETLTNMGLSTGKDSIVKFTFTAHKEEAEDEDGI